MSVSDTVVDFVAPEVERDETTSGTTVRLPYVATDEIKDLGQESLRRSTDFRRWVAVQIRTLVGADAVAALLAVLATTFYAGAVHPAGPIGWLTLSVTVAVGWPMIVGLSHGYARRRLGTRAEYRSVFTAMMIAVVACALPAAWFGWDGLLGTAAVGAPVAALLSGGIRVGLGDRRRRRQRSGDRLRRVIMAGGAESVADLCSAVSQERTAGIAIAGVCVPAADFDRARAMGLPVVGNLDDVAAIAHQRRCHAVAVTGADATRQSFLRELAWSLEDADVDLMVHPGLVGVAGPRLHIQSYTGMSMLHVEQPHFAGWRRKLKRVMDIGLTGLGMLIIWPVLAAVALAVKIDDPKGPVIFKQRRVGIDGKPFTMYKFRSMVTDAERRLAELRQRNEGAGPLFKIENDPRITRIGHFLRRYSLDELPQLFNVLGGSMSLIGPRPPLQAEVDEYATDARRRLKVIPGVTGLWQVSGRSMLTWEESIRLDLHYVENWSVGLDLMILFKTAYAVLAKRGAY